VKEGGKGKKLKVKDGGSFACAFKGEEVANTVSCLALAKVREERTFGEGTKKRRKGVGALARGEE